MALILSIETATKISSVALYDGELLLGHISSTIARSHAEWLMVMISDLLKISKKSCKALHAVAISSGPGSYTGLRIGATVAKGLCYGLEIPLIAIPTLDAMVYGVASFIDDNTLLCPSIDARRTAIYTLMVDRGGQLSRPMHLARLDDPTYQERLPHQPLLFFGDGVLKCKQWLMGHTYARFITGIGMPSAVHLGGLAFPKFQQQLWTAISSYEPIYLS